MSPLASETTPTQIAATPVPPLPGLISRDEISEQITAANDAIAGHVPSLLVRRRKRHSRRANT